MMLWGNLLALGSQNPPSLIEPYNPNLPQLVQRLS